MLNSRHSLLRLVAIGTVFLLVSATTYSSCIYNKKLEGVDPGYNIYTELQCWPTPGFWDPCGWGFGSATGDSTKLIKPGGKACQPGKSGYYTVMDKAGDRYCRDILADRPGKHGWVEVSATGEHKMTCAMFKH